MAGLPDFSADELWRACPWTLRKTTASSFVRWYSRIPAFARLRANSMREKSEMVCT